MDNDLPQGPTQEPEKEKPSKAEKVKSKKNAGGALIKAPVRDLEKEADAGEDEHDTKDEAYKRLKALLKPMGLTPLAVRKMSATQILEKADAEVKAALLESIAIKRQALRYGDAKTQDRVASEFIAMNGMDKKEALQGNAGGSIVINVGTGAAPAWFKRDPVVQVQPVTDADERE